LQRNDALSVGVFASVAREVGYDSEAAFSRAFKKFSGRSPSEWR
jgi:AraC-like DNA-binding protein